MVPASVAPVRCGRDPACADHPRFAYVPRLPGAARRGPGSVPIGAGVPVRTTEWRGRPGPRACTGTKRRHRKVSVCFGCRPGLGTGSIGSLPAAPAGPSAEFAGALPARRSCCPAGLVRLYGSRPSRLEARARKSPGLSSAAPDRQTCAGGRGVDRAVRCNAQPAHPVRHRRG